MTKKVKEEIWEIETRLIDLPEHTDRDDINPDGIKELAESIRELGLLEPILVRPIGDRFELVAGKRRKLANDLLGIGKIKAVVRVFTDNEAVLARAVENLQRVDLTVIEEAKVYRQMVEMLGMSIDEIAKKLGKGAGMVRRKLSLLKLEPILQEAIHKGIIIYSVGEELMTLGNLGKIQYYLGYCVDHGATLQVVRQWVQDEKSKERQANFENAGGGGVVEIPRSLPVYVPCDLCTGPMTIGSETVVRCCPDCIKQLHEIMKKSA